MKTDNAWICGTCDGLKARKAENGRVEIFMGLGIGEREIWNEIHPDHWRKFQAVK